MTVCKEQSYPRASPSYATRAASAFRWTCAAFENPTKLALEMRREWIPKAMLEKVMRNLKNLDSRVRVSDSRSQ